MKILISSTSTDPRLHTSGWNIGYEAAFNELGHDVTSITHGQIPTVKDLYDLFIVRDTTLGIQPTIRVKQMSHEFIMFTHSEYTQASRDPEILRKLSPRVIFMDQPLGGLALRDVPIPKFFIGYGANPLVKKFPYYTPWDERENDVMWVGHGYPERQPYVKKYVWPMAKDERFGKVKIYGAGQPDGPLSIPNMFQEMCNSKIVINICGGGARVGGYGGRRIYDALACGCSVVAEEYPMCKQMFPVGVCFCDMDDIQDRVTTMLNWGKSAIRDREAASEWVRSSQMTTHKAELVLEILENEGWEK